MNSTLIYEPLKGAKAICDKITEFFYSKPWLNRYLGFAFLTSQNINQYLDYLKELSHNDLEIFILHTNDIRKGRRNRVSIYDTFFIICLMVNLSAWIISENKLHIASRELDINEDKLIKKITNFVVLENVVARDDFNYSVTINGSKTFFIDMTLPKGNLKKIIEEMEGDLKAE